jgi:hypothetical protein
MTPEDCNWEVEEILREEDTMPRGFFVYPTNRDLELGDKDWVEAQLNRASEPGYFGFNANSVDFEYFINDVHENLLRDEEFHELNYVFQRKALRSAIKASLAQVFW